MNLVPPREGKGQVKVVDLAAPDRRPRAVAVGTRHAELLEFLRRRGQAERAELLARFPALPPEELLALLEDLVALGRAEFRWLSPFRYGVRCPQREPPADRPLLVARP